MTVVLDDAGPQQRMRVVAGMGGKFGCSGEDLLAGAAIAVVERGKKGLLGISSCMTVPAGSSVGHDRTAVTAVWVRDTGACRVFRRIRRNTPAAGRIVSCVDPDRIRRPT